MGRRETSTLVSVCSCHAVVDVSVCSCHAVVDVSVWSCHVVDVPMWSCHVVGVYVVMMWFMFLCGHVVLL